MAKARAEKSQLEDCKALVSVMNGPALNFLRFGWQVDPLVGVQSAFKSSPLCWTIYVEDGIAGMFGCAPQFLTGVGSPWLVTAPALEGVKLQFIRESRKYLEKIFELFPILTAHVYRGNKPLIGWLKWLGFRFEDVDENFIRGELRKWDYRQR